MIGASRNLTYQELNFAFRLIRRGTSLIVLGGDYWTIGEYLGDKGEFLMEGAFAKILEIAANIKARYVGKPYPEIFKTGLEALGLKHEDVIVIGDSIKSDIFGAYKSGMDAILIDRTGEKEAELIEHIEENADICLSRIYLTKSLNLESLVKRIA